MSPALLQTFRLGAPPWPTVDPFLFCVHHLDRYPAANGRLGPAASLEGRSIGQDFAGIDGWRMYHGRRVPGFPAHPHRGFETVTFVRQGLVDHADSLGAAARYGRGDVQWLTAGSGIVHSEMFPLFDTDGPNVTELFQIWLNLPRADKMAAPHFTMFWADDVPQLGPAEGVHITVIAGAFAGVLPPAPPPASWASRPEGEVAIWHLRLEPGAVVELPGSGHEATVRTLYVYEGPGVEVDGSLIPASTGVVVNASQPTSLASEGGAEVLVLQGRPIEEPVAQYGPFVMNDRAGIEQAFADYRRTGFGGWPWDGDEPVHGLEPVRFARRPDGTVEQP